MATYQFELSWDALDITSFAPADAGHTDFIAAISFQGKFVDSGATNRSVGMQMDLLVHGFGGGPTYEYQARQQDFYGGTAASNPVNLGAPSPDSYLEANGQNGHAFLTVPITLTVVLDDTANMGTFTGPLGTHSYTFAHLGFANGALSSVAMSALGMGFFSNDASVTLTMNPSFYNFYLSTNGVRTGGAELGSVQPGSWVGGTGGVAPWVIQESNLHVTSIADTHTASRLLATISHLTGSLTGGGFVFRDFTGGLGDIDAVIALLCEEDSGVLVYARVIKQAVDSVEVGVSFNSGNTWTTQKVGNVPGRVYATPSLAESPDGAINLFVWDRSTPSTTRWFKTRTQGSTWEDFGILLPVLPWATSTSPRAFTLPTGFFLVSYNQSGHWFLAVYDGGTGASLGIQTTDMGANIGGIDTFPGMYVDALGNVYAARAPTILVQQIFRSKDLGVDWTKVFDNPGGSRQLMAVSSRFSPFIWHLWQTSGGDITVAAAEDYGSVYLFGGITAFAGAVQQYCGIAVLPKGIPIFVFQTYHAGSDSWSVDGFHSADLGRTWVAN